MSSGQSSHNQGNWPGPNQSWQSGAGDYQVNSGHQPPGDLDAARRHQDSAGSTGQASRHPGWLARSLFWAALIIGALPALVLAPMAYAGGPDTMVFYSAGTLVGGVLRLVLGTIAILLVKNTTWARRIVGAGIYLIGSLALVVLTPLISMFMGMSGDGPADSMLTVAIIQGVLSTIYLAAVFCGWSIARNRRWWILVIAVAIAVVLNILNTSFDHVLAAQRAGGVTVAVAVQAVWLVIMFGVLGLCHLLGRIRGGTVPPPSQQARPSQPSTHQWPPGSDSRQNPRQNPHH